MTEVDVSIRIEARPETVFRYFIDPERMRAWMGVAADLDPRPGGELRVNVNRVDVARGKYVEVVAPERIVWTWGWEGSAGLPPGSSTVEVTLAADGDATVVRLRHTGLPDEGSAQNHRQGWTHYLGRLCVAGVGGDPGPDPLLKPAS